MDSINLDDKFDIEIRLNEKFDSIYTLCYALIDLQAVANSTAYITSNLELKSDKIPSTVRNFGKKYKDELKLKTFAQGSFVATVAAGVVTGIILKFLDAYFEKPAVNNLHTHIHGHNGNQNSPIQVKFVNPDIEQSINNILADIDIDKKNIEASLERAISAVNQSGILGQQQIIYARNGLALLAHDIERLGTNINISA